MLTWTGIVAASCASAQAPTSARMTVTIAPNAGPATRRCTAGVAQPERLVRMRRRVPRAGSQLATAVPSAPVPPVTRTAPGPDPSPACGDALTQRNRP